MVKGDWRALAQHIIGQECMAAYLAANTPRKRSHQPYRVPTIAAAIVEALNRDDEHEAKRLFLLWRTGALSLI